MHDASASPISAAAELPDAIDFFRAWDTYAKVVAANYMFHRELGKGVSDALRQRFGGKPFSLLDLGCGDAATLAPLLDGLTLSGYEGADLSKPALALAAKNLARLGCPVTLVESDFMRALAEAARHDVIYTSFALHHLTTDDKAEFFRLAAKKLNPGGLLILVDVMREEGESRETYFHDYCAWLRQTMTSLAREELDKICEHLTQNDRPEPASLIAAQAERAGLKVLPGLVPHKWHHLMLFAPA